MDKCSFCGNVSVEGRRCYNCGAIVDEFNLFFYKTTCETRLTITDRYLIFRNSGSFVGEAMTQYCFGIIGSLVYTNSKFKQMSMIDLSAVAGVEVYYPQKKSNPAIKIYLKSGWEMPFVIAEQGKKDKNVNRIIWVLNTLGIPYNYFATEYLPDITSRYPIANNPKDFFNIFSRSALQFMKPNDKMRCID